MTFKSTKVEKTGDTTAKVTGDLTDHGRDPADHL
jgi:polyisoprenoid-binding protein YceI